MAKPTSAVKRAWNKAHYDVIYLSIKKGLKEKLRAEAKDKGFKNLTEYIMYAVSKERNK